MATFADVAGAAAPAASLLSKQGASESRGNGVSRATSGAKTTGAAKSPGKPGGAASDAADACEAFGTQLDAALPVTQDAAAGDDPKATKGVKGTKSADKTTNAASSKSDKEREGEPIAMGTLLTPWIVAPAPAPPADTTSTAHASSTTGEPTTSGVTATAEQQGDGSAPTQVTTAGDMGSGPRTPHGALKQSRIQVPNDPELPNIETAAAAPSPTAVSVGQGAASDSSTSVAVGEPLEAVAAEKAMGRGIEAQAAVPTPHQAETSAAAATTDAPNASFPRPELAVNPGELTIHTGGLLGPPEQGTSDTKTEAVRGVRDLTRGAAVSADAHARTAARHQLSVRDVATVDRKEDPLTPSQAAADRREPSSQQGGNGSVKTVIVPTVAQAPAHENAPVVFATRELHQPPTPIVPTLNGAVAADGAVVADLPVSGSPDVPDADTPQRLVQSLRMQFLRGGGDAVVQLRPEHLGPVTVSLKVEQGTVSARITAADPVVAEWLQAHQDTLREGLQANGLTLDRLTVERDGRPPDRRERREQAPRQRFRPASEPQSTFELTI